MTGESIEEGSWRLFPPLMAGIGLATGLIVHGLVGDGLAPDIGAFRLAALSFVTVTAILFGFVAIRDDVPRSGLFALGGGTVAALILYFNGPTSGWSASEGWRMFCLAVALGIAAPLFQSARTTAFRSIPYPCAHDSAWTNVVLWCLGWVFVAIVVILSFLLSELFNLIGIRFLRNWLQEGWFWRPLVGLAFGLGLALLREHSRIVRMLQKVAMLVLGVLAPVLALGLGLFLLALPFTGLQPLWDATKSTTPILLACLIGALLLVNAVIGDGEDDGSGNRVLRWAAFALSLTMLPLAAIASYALRLRIGQYGYTPERLWALTFVVLACVVATAYLVCVIRGRWRWAERVRPANLMLAMIVCGVTLLLATPLLSFNAISTRDQVARLQSGKVAPDRFDWAALAFDFGAPGRAALRRLKSSANPEIRRIAADIERKPRRWDIDAVTPDPVPRIAALEKRLRVLPRAVTVPIALKEALIDPGACGAGEGGCTLLYAEGARRAIALRDDCFTVPDQASPSAPVAIRIDRDCGRPIHLVETAGQWKPRDPGDPGQRPDGDRAAIRSGYRDGKVEIRTVPRQQVFVGGVPVGDPFE
ncbi:DUF4153 domain-containing protein [Sphingomonas sp.]|uniref:DUF4153 domain-containing protein n=1 Tax=Sphingomonas sp. TaxID=28214 RepID=UPI001EB17F15|nr:DUF4153 domain-containing protein [Sphingomonas sp.]MBX3595202.1 DUF4153 domain-containing protein [Sphingomonas sp.]